MQTESSTQILEKKYKRIRNIANELVNKNTIYQDDLAKAEKRIETMENAFNNLVDNFQKYINEHEDTQKTQNVKSEKLSDHEDALNGFGMDQEARNEAVSVFEQICEDFPIAQERDEMVLDTVQKYIYDRKMPNLAYWLWDQCDFSH